MQELVAKDLLVKKGEAQDILIKEILENKQETLELLKLYEEHKVSFEMLKNRIEDLFDDINEQIIEAAITYNY